jgi:hypothetical protein
MMVPRSTMEKDLKSQEKALTDEINSLGKKVTFPHVVLNLSSYKLPLRLNIWRNSSAMHSPSYATL